MIGRVFFTTENGTNIFSFDYRTHNVSMDANYFYVTTIDGMVVFGVPREKLINFVVKDYAV